MVSAIAGVRFYLRRQIRRATPWDSIRYSASVLDPGTLREPS
jgi:hypothetical protein